MNNIYDKDYFENGPASGKSLYTNFSWMPDLTFSMCMSYIDYLGLTKEHRILDYGCAKGFVVKALRLLHRQAWGCDVSKYAVNCADNDTRKYLKICESDIVPFQQTFDFIIAKDVFEHISEDEIDNVLTALRAKGKKLFAVIPLGENDKFVIPAYQLDITHKLAKSFDWWDKRFEANGWEIEDFYFNIPGIKDSWANFDRGNGFWLLR